MGKTVVIMQSNYIPWRGYFDLIDRADVFVVYDEAQYTKNDWRNRNKLKTVSGSVWLTIPIRHVTLCQSIDETKIADRRWRTKHCKTIEQHYRKAKSFHYFYPILEELYRSATSDCLSTINLHFITAINKLLGIQTPVLSSREFSLTGSASQRLVQICKKLGATRYLTGPSARNYLDFNLFEKECIEILWMSYEHYGQYPQLYPPFLHNVSILDLLFNVAPTEYPNFISPNSRK